MSPDKKRNPDLAFTRFGFMYSKMSSLESRFKNLLIRMPDSTGYELTETESAKKKLRIQKYPDTCRGSLKQIQVPSDGK